MSKDICGDCTLCCKLPPIFKEKRDGSLDYEKPFKEFNEWCTHCSTKKGCDIYDDRPDICKGFYCLYAQSKLEGDPMDEAFYPKKSKFFVTIENEARLKEGQVSIYIDETRHYDVFTKAPYNTFVKNLLDNGWKIILTAGKKVFLYQKIGDRYAEFKFPEPFVFGKRNKANPIPMEIVFGSKH